MADPRRALIVSTGRDRGALAAARALHRSGWVVGVGTPDGGGMVGASRAASALHIVPKPRGDSRAFVTAVNEAVAEGGYQTVFGSNDDWMAALSAYRAHLPVPVAHPDFAVVTSALDKVCLDQHADAVGLASPHTEAVTDAALARWRGPAVVKCRAHWTPGQTRPHRIDARLFEGAGQIRAQVDLITAAGGEPVLQRPVHGHLGALVGVFDGTGLRGRVQQTTSRLWPTPHGMSARARTIPVDEDLTDRSEALLRRIGWTGLVELQFLTGPDGVPHLIDLNGRFYGSLALADEARPGLVDAWGRMVLGEDLPDLRDGRVGIRFAWWAGDFRRAASERHRGLALDLLGTFCWGVGARHSVWDVRDLGPVLQLARERTKPPAAPPEEPLRIRSDARAA